MRVILADLKIFLLLVLLSCLLFLFDRLGFFAFPRSFLEFLTVPVQYGLYEGGKSISHQFELVSQMRKAAQENKALKKQLGELIGEKSALQKRLAEVEALINQRQGLSATTFDLTPARPIGVDRYLLIDKGENDGIKTGQVVIFKDNYLGQIKFTSSKTSRVILPQDPDSKLAVFSQNKTGRAKGILTGQFGSELLMDKILHQEPVEVGDLVYSEGTEGKLPRGLVMGKIREVLERQNEIFKQAMVEPILNLADLDMVFVIRDY